MKILKCDKVVVDSGSMTAYLEEDPVAMLDKGGLIIFEKPECPPWDWAIRQVLEQGEERMAEKCFCDKCGAQVKKDSPIAPEVKKRADEIKALREKYFLSFDEALCLIKSSWLF